MKRIAVVFAVFACFAVPAARAQNHVEVGAFAEYFRLSETSTNLVGLGARAGVNVNKYFQVEAEMGYDFTRAFTESFTNPTTHVVTLQRSNLHALHGLIGPKLQTGGKVRAFVTVKGGFENFSINNRPGTFAGFASSVDDLRTSNVHGVLYPGGGLEAFLGPIGLRLDIGDEIYFAGGAHNNWKVSFGPTIRF
jgi:hypothetical protein